MDTCSSLSSLKPLEQLYLLLAEMDRRTKTRRLFTYYPDEGPLRRELYPRHMEFFAAGTTHRQRVFMAANRVGKTEGAGGYEMALHLTGQYPDWWTGHRFDKPIQAWAAGDTSQTVRDILQVKLLGPVGQNGTGLIPGDDIVDIKSKAGGIKDAVETVYVRHASGGLSVLGFKTYDQGRESFQGTERGLVWLDEEPPLDVYMECLLRTMATASFGGGLVMLTFTPLMGLSETVMHIMDGEVRAECGEVRPGGAYLVSAT